MCEARYRPWQGGVMRSSRRWITSVGTWIAGSTARTSMSRIIRIIRRNALGLIAIRSNRPNSSRARSEPARLGMYHSMLAPCPQRFAAISPNPANISSVPCPHG
jgi:hypothetical protein